MLLLSFRTGNVTGLVFSDPPPPPSPYGYLVITATLFWPLGKTGHVAIQRPYIFL